MSRVRWQLFLREHCLSGSDMLEPDEMSTKELLGSTL